MPKNRYQVYWTEIAQSDLESIIEYAITESETGAYNVYNTIKSACDELVRFPKRGRIVPELEYFFIKNYREIVIQAWRVIYRIEGENVYISAVLDSRRNMEDILLSRLLK